MRCVMNASLVIGFMVSAPALVRADDEADMKALIDKAVKAHGGAERLAKLKASTMKFKGKYYGGGGDGLDYTGEMSMQFPGQLRNDIMFDAGGMKFTVVNVLNGDKGWVSLNGKVQEMPKETLAENKEGMYANWVGSLYPLTDKEFKLSPLGESKAGDKEAVGVRVSRKDHRDINLYFDKKSGLLVKMEHQIKDEMEGFAEKTQESFFDDFKEVDGVPYSMKLVIKRGGKNFVDAEVTEVKLLEKLDDKTFEKP